MRTRILIALLILGASVSAQQPTAILAGRLVDPNGAVVGNTAATVTAKNTASGAEFTSEVLASGAFSLKGLPRGTYDVTANFRSAMYSTSTRKGVAVKAGENK